MIHCTGDQCQLSFKYITSKVYNSQQKQNHRQHDKQGIIIKIIITKWVLKYLPESF